MSVSSGHYLAGKSRHPQARRPAPPLDQRARAITLHSRALGIRKQFFIYTPPGYAKLERMPVLYLFRGHEAEWINPQQDHSREQRTVLDEYEELLRLKLVGPMILVFPGISSDDNSVPGLLVNFRRPELAPQPGIGHGRFADYFLQELMPYVDTFYRTDTSARGADGFSLGGFMAVKLAAQYPLLFRSVGTYDGLYFWDDPANADLIATSDATFRNPLFDPAFGAGAERDHAYAAAHNPLNLILRGDAAKLRQLAWLIEYGPESGEPNDSNFYRGARLCQLLADQGIVNQGRGEIVTSTHSWRCADEHMRHVLPLHWQALTARR